MIPRVSVVIPTYNYGRYIVEAIESVLNQTFPDREVIVVDDGSTDDTGELIGRFGDRVRYIYQRNLGPSAARNTGIRAARGEYVGFLDSDDLWLPEKLALQVAVLDSCQAVGLVYSDALFFRDETQAIIGAHREVFPHPAGRILAQLVLGNVISSPTPLVRRSILDRVGLFDEDLKASEDWDLWIRIAKICEIAYIDQPLAKYRRHRHNKSLNTKAIGMGQLLVLNKIFADADLPREIERLRRVAYSNLYTEIGLTYFIRGEYESARADLLQAVKLRPQLLLGHQVALCLFCSLLGPTFAAKIRSYKGKALSLLSGSDAR